MIHIVNEKHDYNSPLRQEQAQRTRTQILDGLMKAMTHSGLAQLSIPAVAREAGVSVPTVYRYFRTKQELIDALGNHLLHKLQGEQPHPAQAPRLPQSPEDLEEMVRAIFLSFERLDETTKAAAMGAASYEMRKEILPMRIQMIEQALASVTMQISEDERVHLRNMILILCSTAMVRNFHDYLGISGSDAAETVIWAIRRLTNVHSPDEEKEER